MTELLHPEVMKVLQDLSDPEKSVQRALVKGEASGLEELIGAQFPPQGIRHDQVFARFVFAVEGHTSFELHLMVYLVHYVEDGDTFALGLITNDQWHGMYEQTGKKIGIDGHWVAVKYSPTMSEGSAFMFNETYAVIKEVADKELITPPVQRASAYERSGGFAVSSLY